MVHLRVATFNIRNITDRYDERMPLLGAAFAEIGADVIGLQEVILNDGGPGKPRQDDYLSSQLSERHYKSLVSPHQTRPYFANAILCAAGEVLAHETLPLSTGRTAQRVLLALEGKTLWFANTHLHHVPGEPAVREEQAMAICRWMAEAPAADATFIVGDFNTPPFEPAYTVMVGAGYSSAMKAVHGKEPDVTWPSGIQAETMDTDGDPNCLDYIWCAGDVRVVSAKLTANQHPPEDATIYPSDHFAIVAECELFGG
jgi:endonuclease/exonuclease/phosphatase family metal-dependent hydrolase